MVRRELYVTVPRVFRCPISLDVMRSPVSLCTGVTYDRSSIQRWLESGHETCPATNQHLPSKDFVPNLTLRRLISLWSSSQSLSSSPAPISRRQLPALLNAVENQSGDSVESLSKIAEFVRYSEENRRFVAAEVDGFVEVIVDVLRRVSAEVGVLELAIKVLDLVIPETGVTERVQNLFFMSNSNSCLPSISSILESGSSSSKIETLRVLESIAIGSASRREIVENGNISSKLINLLTSENDSAIIAAVFSCLISITSTRLIKTQLVQLGLVPITTRTLSDPSKPKAVIEKCLQLSSLLSLCPEGRAAMCKEPNFATAITRWMMKVSPPANDDAVSVLFSICCLCGDKRAQEAVLKEKGMTKVLLVMQSGCGEGVKKLCGDLIKTLRNGNGVNRSGLGLGGFETKTIHVMPY